eukprot:COSAG02_NODE_7746_length_2863_cov_41.939942_1_plen_522_part_10
MPGKQRARTPKRRERSPAAGSSAAQVGTVVRGGSGRKGKVDRSTLGFISHTLRIQLWDAIHHGRTLYGKPCTSIRSFFKAVDKANKGSVRRNALGAALTRLDVGLSEAQVVRLLKTMDADNSGGVDFAEFSSWMRGDVVLQEIDEIVDVLNFKSASSSPAARDEPPTTAEATEQPSPTSVKRDQNALTVATAVVKCMEDERFVEGLFAKQVPKPEPGADTVKLDVFIALQKDRAGLRDELRAVRKQLAEVTEQKEAAVQRAASAEAASQAAEDRADRAEEVGARKVVELHAALGEAEEQAKAIGAQQLIAQHANNLEKQELITRLDQAQQLIVEAQARAASLQVDLDEARRQLSDQSDDRSEQNAAVAQLRTRLAEYEDNMAQQGDARTLEKQVRLRQFLLRCCMRDASRAWSRWVDSTASHKRVRMLAQKVVGRLTSMRVHAAFGRWRDMASEARSQRDRLSRVVSRIQQATVYAALSRWQEYTSEVLCDRALLTKVMGRMLNIQLSGAWCTWVSAVDEVV